jgi:hypothetical protein
MINEKHPGDFNYKGIPKEVRNLFNDFYVIEATMRDFLIFIGH